MKNIFSKALGLLLSLFILNVSLTLAATVQPTTVSVNIENVIDRVDTIAALRSLVGSTSQSVQVMGYYVVGDGGGGPVRHWDAESICTDDGGACIDPLTTGPGRWIFSSNIVNPSWFGAVGNGIADDSIPLQKSVASVSSNLVLILDKSYLSSGINFEHIADSIEIQMSGNLKHKAVATASLLKFGTTGVVKIHGSGTLDGNFTKQINFVHIIEKTGVDKMYVSGLIIKNVKKTGIFGQLSKYTLADYRNLTFLDGAKHTGIINQGARFIGEFGGAQTNVVGCTFTDSVDPNGTQVRQVCGVMISGGNPDKKILIQNNKFTNLGNNVADNLESPLDTYSYAKEVKYIGNVFEKSRYIPFRITNFGVAVVEDNVVTQNVPIIYDGGKAYNSAVMFSAGIVGRGYKVNNRDNELLTFRNNQLSTNQASIGGLILSSDSKTYLFHSAVLNNNIIIGAGGNTLPGVFVNNVKKVTIEGGQVVNFKTGIRVQQTSNITPLSNLKAQFSARNVSIKGALVGYYARTSVTNLDSVLDNCDIEASSYPFSVRSSGNLTVNNCNLKGKVGDTSANAGVLFTNNR